MRISARNQFPAITAESARQLGLEPGKRVIALIKSTEVLLAVDN